ncbi:MAG: hypothetical protein ACREWG_18005 [Gammaproteobacteria bacterium]
MYRLVECRLVCDKDVQVCRSAALLDPLYEVADQGKTRTHRHCADVDHYIVYVVQFLPMERHDGVPPANDRVV